MIRRRLVALCAAACVAAFTTLSHAAVITVSTVDHPLGSTSQLNINIDVLGLQSIAISDIAISGAIPVDYLLDGTNTGTIQALGGTLNLADVNQNFSGLLLEGSVQTNGITAELFLGPEAVVNRDFQINSSSLGSLGLTTGTLQLTITGGSLGSTVTGLLGTNVVVVDLAEDPLAVEFSGLGTTVVNGTADIDGSGLNPDGAEFNLPLTFGTTLDLSGIALVVTTTGGLFLGSPPIPEFGSFGLVGVAVAGLGAFAGIRRRRKA